MGNPETSDGSEALAAWDQPSRSLFAVSRHSLKSIDYTSSFAALFDAKLQMTPGASGTVTPHGRKYASLVGNYYRQQYGSQLFSSAQCAEIEAGVRMYADTDDRDITSGDLWLAGFAPECNLTSITGDFMHELINEGH